MGIFDVLLVGHRGTGKTTTAHHMRELGWPVVDLDHHIESVTGRTCADLVAEDEPAFRALEHQSLQNLTHDTFPTARLLVPGAGCLTFPHAALVVWLRREDWFISAKNERRRLRPALSFDAEVEWMKTSREPAWAARADLILDVPRGRAPQRVAAELHDLLAWARSGGTIPQKTWLIGNTHPERLAFLVGQLQLQGIERRSDLPDFPHTQLNELISLRTADPVWLLQHPQATAIDVDIQHLPAVLAARTLDHLHPRPLILSAHPADLNTSIDFRPYLQSLKDLHPAWTNTQTKLAASLTADRLDLPADTLLPIQPTMNGWRAFQAFKNKQNYLATGAKPSRKHPGQADAVPAMDLQDWLPYFGLGHHPRFACLVGDPVEASQGTWWHRREAQRHDEELAYLKINCPRGELAHTLPLLAKANIHAVSVTSPLKIEAAQSCATDGEHLPALNTMKYANGAWHGTDTDQLGMAATLDSLTLTDKTVLLIGTGGVAPAVLRALQTRAAKIHHVSARHQPPWPPADVVINASGKAVDDAPGVDVWIDLHYTHVAPANARVHLNGDLFFEAQALAQRQFWGWSPHAR